MRATILHHGGCFDGAASAAVFAAFFRAWVEPRAQLRFVAKHHRPGDPYDDDDFAGDVTAVVDFRYTTRVLLDWFFDHHPSAFQLAGEREHFEARLAGAAAERMVHDPAAPSCTGLVARVLERRFGFDPHPHAELIAWADRIDRACFRDPRQAIELDEPALRLMAFAENNQDPALIERFALDLGGIDMVEHARLPYVEHAVAPVLARIREEIDLFGQRCRIRGGVAEYDLLDLGRTGWNKFLAYYHHPEARYAVGLGRGPDGCIRLSAGYNPWLPAAEREHDLAALCERIGGGGHAYVGGASFFPHRAELAQTAKAFIAATLRGEAHETPGVGR